MVVQLPPDQELEQRLEDAEAGVIDDARDHVDLAGRPRYATAERC